MRENTMSKFTAEVPTSSVPAPPKQCEVCIQPVDVLKLTVYDERGQTHTGPFSDFGYKKGEILHLKDQYTYANWLGLCTDCHTFDGKRKIKDKKHSELLKEHWIKAGSPKTKEECMAAMYKINPGMARLIGRFPE